MFNLMKFKYAFFAISLVIILPGIYSLVRYGLNPSIDFTGGTLLELKNEKLTAENLTDLGVVQKTSSDSYLIRTKEIDTAAKDKIITDLTKRYGPTELLKFETVGPVIGAELTQKALQAILIASIAIVLYIAYAFREIPKPYSSFKFGISAFTTPSWSLTESGKTCEKKVTKSPLNRRSTIPWRKPWSDR